MTIDPERVAEAKTLLAGGLSQAETARRTGISRGTIGNVARGRRPDYAALRERAEGEKVDPRDTLLPGERRLCTGRRCGGCGGLLEIVPCRLCKIRRLLEAGGVSVSDGNGKDDPLRLELQPEDYRRYLPVHADRVVAEQAAGTIAAVRRLA